MSGISGPVTDIAPGAVDTAAIADDAVDSAKILDGDVLTVDLGDGQVTEAKLDSAVAGRLPVAVDGVDFRGQRTISEINALAGVKWGTTVVAGSAGTPSDAGSDLLAVGDVAEWRGPTALNKGWQIIVTNNGGTPPAGTKLVAADGGVTVFSPLTNNTDNAKLAVYPGGSLTPTLTTLPKGARAVITNANAFNIGRSHGLVGPVPTGYWDPDNLSYYDVGEGLEKDSSSQVLQVREGPGLQILANAVRVQEDGQSLIISSSGVKVRSQLDVLIAAADATGGATAASFSATLREVSGATRAQAGVLLLYASNSQYGGPRDPNAHVTIDTITSGSVLASDAASGWWLVKSGSNGVFAANINNDSDETVWFSATTADCGVDAAANGVVVRGCVPDSATWSA